MVLPGSSYEQKVNTDLNLSQRKKKPTPAQKKIEIKEKPIYLGQCPIVELLLP